MRKRKTTRKGKGKENNKKQKQNGYKGQKRTVLRSLEE